MNIKKKIMAKALDGIITILEVNIVNAKKHDCIKRQMFEEASRHRDREKELVTKLPTTEELATWRAALTIVEDHKDVPSKKK